VNCPHCQTPNPEDARFCAACGKATSYTAPASIPGVAGGPPAAEPIGKEIAGRYRILSKLGEGGMGAVYKAEQISLKRTCAVKILRPEVAGTAIVLRRFNAEAEAVAKLSHPNIVNIYDFGQDTDGTLFIAMEFVEGKSLREVIHAEAPLSIHRALAIASQVATSLVEAHSHAIIHRDLKPDNVMLQSRGRAKDVVRVLDFGIAKLRDEGRATQAAMTQAGDMLGTPQYMAPEQIRAEQIDGRTDVYALGCMIYEMVTARLPFEAPTLMALLSKHLMEPPVPPSQRRPDLMIPPALDELVMIALAKDPQARPPTMEAYGERIAAVLATLPAEPGASATHSAVVGVPAGSAAFGAGAPSHHPHGVATPPGAFGAFAPHTPPPAGYAPTPPPGSYPGGPPPGPPAPGYGTPQAQFSPYAQPHAGAAPARSGMPVILIVVLAVVGLGGIAAAVYFATRGSDEPSQVAEAGDAGAADDPDPEPRSIDALAEAPDPDPPEPDDPDDGDGDDPWSGGGGGGGVDFVAKMREFRDAMCACSDAACVTRVNSELQKWSIDLAKHGLDMTNLDLAATQQIQQIGTELASCSLEAAKKAVAKPTAKVLSPNDQLDRLATRSCACKDVACGRRVLREVVALLRKHGEDGDAARAEVAGVKLATCLVRVGVTQQELANAVESARR
jgi:eukaryotic-like serine/threonine-protein kinase